MPVKCVKRLLPVMKNIYQKLGGIIIDEFSRGKADVMDCVDWFLKLNGKNPTRPFGGVQMIRIGDLYQLPTVVLNKEEDVFKILKRLILRW